MFLFRCCLSFMLLIFLGCGAVTFDPQAPSDKPIKVFSTNIPLYPDDPSTSKVGRLSYMGGLDLSSPDKRFGGFSGIISMTHGKDFHAISDHGWFISSTLSYYKSGRLASLVDPVLSRLRDMNGGPLPLDKRFSDCEGIAPFPGVFAVTFEQEHRILIYPSNRGLSGVPGSIPFPPFLHGAPSNQGAEAICSFPGDRLLIFMEYEPAGDWGVSALGNGTVWHKFQYKRTKGFRPSAASYSSSGFIYVLERFYNPALGVKIRVVRFKADSVRPGSRVEPELMALLEPPMNIDNMEGITVFNRNGMDHLLMISDNNYSSTQRTLLMFFKVVE